MFLFFPKWFMGKTNWGVVLQGSGPETQRRSYVPLTQQVMLRWIVNEGMADGLFVSAGEVMAH